MKTALCLGVAGLAVLTALGSARTQDKGPPKKLPGPQVLEMLKKSPEEFIKQFDKNMDGFLQKDELPPFLAKTFERFDKNSDGKLNREEVDQMLKATRQFLLAAQQAGGNPPDFDALDKNADGRLTKEELKGTPWLARFAEIDANGDGQIDRREWEAFFRRSAEKKKD